MCDTEMSAATACVASDSACSTCFDPTSFAATFPNDAKNYFRASLAFRSPTDPEFCVEANWRVCKKFDPVVNGESSCCCTAETKAYMQCKFQDGWMSKYNITDTACQYEGCELFDLDGNNSTVASIFNLDGNNSAVPSVFDLDGTNSVVPSVIVEESSSSGSGGGGNMMMIIIGAVLIALLVICVVIVVLVICFYCHKKRLTSAAATKDDDNGEEKGGNGKKVLHVEDGLLEEMAMTA